MKNITIDKVGECISEALNSKKKNILFVDLTLRYEHVTKWAKQNQIYQIVRKTPGELHEEKNGILVKTGRFCLANKDLDQLNLSNSIWFIHAFSEKCIEGFNEVLNAIQNRIFINKFSDDEIVKFTLDKLPLFIGFTTPHNPNDLFALDEKYYSLFDEVYFID